MSATQATPRRRFPWNLVPEWAIVISRPVRHYFLPQTRFDRTYGVETRGLVPPEEVGVDPETRRDASHYEPTPRAVFVRILTSNPLDHPRFTFIDLGSGKGATLLYASEFPFRRIIGVELSAALDEIAQRNIALYRSRSVKCTDVQSLRLDARAFVFPIEPTLLFLFNPFKGQVLDQVVLNLERSLEAHPREVVVVYHHPESRHPALDHSTRLRQVRRERDYTLYQAR